MRRALPCLALAVACGASRPKGGHSAGVLVPNANAHSSIQGPCLAWCHDNSTKLQTSWPERCSRPDGHCRGCSECATPPAKERTRKVKHGPRVIVMFTDREMPCFQAAREQLQAYAERTNATLRITTKRHDDAFSGLPGGKLGGGPENARFAKLWLAGHALREGASYVAVFDDTVLVNERALDLFALAEAAGGEHIVGQLEDRYLTESACNAYAVDNCNTSTRMINSGLVVFSQRHLALFDDPLMKEHMFQLRQRPTTQLWEPGDKPCVDGFCDQALLNAQLQRHATPVLDLNRNNPNCSHAYEGEGKLDVSQHDTLLARATCRVAVGSVLRRLNYEKVMRTAARGLCFAHVTKGAANRRDDMLCDLSEMLRCEAA